MSIAFHNRVARGLFLAGLLLMAASLPLSRIGMSVGQFLMGFAWFLEGRYATRVRALLKDHIALALVSVFLLHVLGLLWTSDFQWALKDLRIKLPLFVLPILFSTGPRLKQKETWWVTGIFVAAVLAGSFISSYRALFWDIQDPRELSPYVSHIRFSLEVCLAISFLVVFAMASRQMKWRWTFVLLALWLFLFLFILRAFTGFLVFSVVSFLAVGHAIVHSKARGHKLAWAGALAFMLLLAGGGYYLLKTKVIDKEQVDFSALPTHTLSGNPYDQDTNNRQTINGHYIWLSICQPELRKEWEERSDVPYDHVDENGELSQILIRYMSSLGLSKDSVGMSKLSDDDIRAVESGQAYAGSGIPGLIMARVNDIFRSLDHYRQTGEAQGNSLTQRLELWSNGWSLFKANWLIGTGTGDIRDDFAQELERRGSSMAGSHLRAHNQILTLAATFGVIGLLLIAFAVLWPVLRLRKWGSPMYTLFILIAVVSMFTEDTLETQTGATFFAFFNSFLLLYRADPMEESPPDGQDG